MMITATVISSVGAIQAMSEMTGPTSLAAAVGEAVKKAVELLDDYDKDHLSEVVVVVRLGD